MQVDNDNDLHKDQRSSEVKFVKLCAMANICGPKTTDAS